MFGGINSFIAFFGVLSLLSSSFFTIMISQISNLEKAFGLSSSESGWMLTTWEMGYVVSTVIASYFARRAHLPRTIGVATIVIGLTGFLFALPHFVAFSEPRITENETLSAKSTTEDDVTLCTFNQQASNSSSDESYAATVGHFVKTSSKMTAYVLFIVANIIQGAAKAPRYPYSAKYVDDNVDKQKTGFYVGMLFTNLAWYI